jgi:hypothetical protein
VAQFDVVADRSHPTEVRSPMMSADTPLRPRVPKPSPLPLGEPMRLEPLPWRTWAENGVVLLTLSLTRLAGR